MNLKDYQKAALRTMASDKPMYDVSHVLVHCVIGICTEGGELLSSIKKSLFYGSPADNVNIREEIGDLMWYIQNLCTERGWDLEEILSENIRKLQVRYPEKFTPEHAPLRLDKND